MVLTTYYILPNECNINYVSLQLMTKRIGSGEELSEGVGREIDGTEPAHAFFTNL